MAKRRRPRVITKDTYLRGKVTVLKDFGIDATPDIRNELEKRYPNEVSIESYTRKLILDKLKDNDDY